MTPKAQRYLDTLDKAQARLDFERWVAASCQRSGVPIKVADRRVIANAALLLGAR